MYTNIRKFKKGRKLPGTAKWATTSIFHNPKYKKLSPDA